jgi:2-polyprenyl-3-methyl-5-hydroxy-6-metoxy-1,4-benzoquinol methylase
MEPISLYKFGGSETFLRQYQSRFVELFRGFSPVLDIGCGRGVFLELVQAAGMEVVGVDHAQESMEFCRSKGLSAYCEDARSFLARHPGQFGGIFCSHVIEHMGYQEAVGFLQLCGQALRTGGRLVLLTPNPEDLAVISEIFWLDPTHVRPYPRLLLQSMLEANGFSITQAKQFLGSWRMIGRSKFLLYLWRRMLLGRYYGRPNTLIVASKASTSAENASGSLQCQSR